MTGKLFKWSPQGLLAVITAISLSIGIYFVYPGVTKLKKVNPAGTAFMEHREKDEILKEPDEKPSGGSDNMEPAAPEVIEDKDRQQALAPEPG